MVNEHAFGAGRLQLQLLGYRILFTLDTLA